jgi:DNA mismatch endonuclease (patch repair protein)
LCYSPKSNVEFWTAKFEKNVARDVRDAQQLGAQGWKVVVIWECETKKPELVQEILKCEVCDATG